MAATPSFPAGTGGFGAPVSITGTCTKASSTGAVNILRQAPGVNGGIWNGAAVYIVAGSVTPNAVNFFLDDDAAAVATFLGELVWTHEVPPASSNQSSTLAGVFIPAGGPVLLRASDQIMAGLMVSGPTLHIRSLGGVY